MDTSKVVAVQGAADFIGELLWYTIPALAIEFKELEELLDGAGIPKKFMPMPTSRRDAFRRAVKEAEARHPLEDSKTLNLLVREVANDSKLLVYQVVREIVDSQNRRLSYEPVIELRLEGENRQPEHGYTSEITDHEVAALCKVENAFDRHLAYHDSSAVRRIVRNVLQETGYVSVRPSGGVFFIPKEHTKTVKSIVDFIRALENYTDCGFKPQAWSVPVVDSTEQREMVAASLDNHIETEAGSLAKDLEAAAKRGAVQQKTLDGYMARIQQLKSVCVVPEQPA